MKLMNKIMSFLLMIVLSFSLSSCFKYVSSYNAIGLVRMNTSHSCETSFYSLTGRIVFNIKKTKKEAGDIYYFIQVEEGEVSLYYDIYGEKEELAHAKKGETIEGNGGSIVGGKKVYIIIEVTDNSRGKVSVELDK